VSDRRRRCGVADGVIEIGGGARSQVLARNTLLDVVLGTTFDIGASFARWPMEPAARKRATN
jgi:hypothetical protein